MSDENHLRTANVLMLQWHSGAWSMRLEAFQAWALAALGAHLYFDGAIWGLLADLGSADGSPVSSVHLHRIAHGVMDQFERLRPDVFDEGRPVGRVANVCLSDSVWAGPSNAALREHAHQFGLTNALSARFEDSRSPGQQFVVLARSASAHRFTADEAADFELMAPHLMHAYATCRKVFIDSQQTADRRVAGFAVALLDRAGAVHDQDPRFLSMMRREWSDWPGRRLPEPLLNLAARRAGARWRFLGAQISADFIPVGDLYLATVRPRHVADVLTPREGEVAQRYAAGGNFREIAHTLQLSPATVRSHLRKVFAKLQIRDKAQLAAILH